MGWLTKIHGRKTPPGLEVRILKMLPRITLVGTLAIVAMPVIVRFWPAQPGVDAAKHIKSVDIFAIATEITLITAVFTVAIGCVVVHIMKGPAYVADGLPVSHADRPKHEPLSGDEAPGEKVRPGEVRDSHD
jgi:NADH:ubiquinone oxidoreductase subunit 5 (subunit L)/multisubunit Na+/H+ antiporter MnhA subunit